LVNEALQLELVVIAAGDWPRDNLVGSSRSESQSTSELKGTGESEWTPRTRVPLRPRRQPGIGVLSSSSSVAVVEGAVDIRDEMVLEELDVDEQECTRSIWEK
jgi:hypothetical protein